MLKQAMFAGLVTLSSHVLAQQATAMTATDLYGQYKRDPLAADAKYEGHRVTVSGRVIKTDFVDVGVGHIRMILLAGDQSNSTTESVAACFTESCSSFKRPTVGDDAFKSMKVGTNVSFNCNVEPIALAGTRKNGPVMLQLSKCALP